MPGIRLNNQSGGQLAISGAWYSGNGSEPIGSILFRAAVYNSGAMYVGLSGGITINSGGLNLSGFANGSGLMDAVPVYPGDCYQLPRLATLRYSGNFNVYIATDPAVSGQGYAFWEIF